MGSDDLNWASTQDADSFDEDLRAIAAAPNVHPPRPTRELEAGTLVADTFRVERKLGEGGMGVVYLVHDVKLERPVALKLQRKESGQSTLRMAREARAMARLSHPNVVPIHEVGQHEGQLFIAMEYIPGGTVRQWLETPRSWREIVDLFLQAGHGLAAAHAIELVHRDFKPDNVMVGEHGRARVADFGLARTIVTKQDDGDAEHNARSSAVSNDRRSVTGLESRPGSSSSSERASILSNKLTQTGAAVGTMAYMAPEQWGGAELDARADQFSFCVALFEALCGVRPFAGRSAGPLLYNIQSGQIRDPLPGRRVPRRILKILRRGLAPDSESRFPSMLVLLRKLDRQPVSRRRVAVSLVALGVATVVGAAVSTEEAVDPCEAGVAEMRSLWTPAIENELQDAAEATGKPHAVDALDRALRPLSSYADQWANAYKSACESTHVRKEQTQSTFELVAACLAERRQAFEGVVGELRSGELAKLESSVGAVTSLPYLEPCTNPSALGQLDPLPSDAEARGSLLKLRAEIQALPEQASDMDYEDGIARAQGLLDRAKAIGYRPTIGRARLVIVGVQTRARRITSDDQVRKAFNDALASGDYHLAADAAARSVEFYAPEDAPEAHRWGSTGTTLLDKIGASKSAYLRLLRAEAVAYGMAKDLEHAEPVFREIIDSLTAEDPEDPKLARAYADLAVTLANQGEFEAAATSFEEAHARTIQAKGSRHPDGALALANVARIRLRLGERRVAIGLFEEARARLAAAYGDEYPEVARLDNDLADLYAGSGEMNRAIALLEHAIKVMRTTDGHRLPERFEAEVLYSQLLAETGRDSEAADALKVTIETIRELGMPARLSLALTEGASQAHRRGDHRAAIELGHEANEAWRQTESSSGRTTTWLYVGQAHLALEELEDAEAAFRSVIESAAGRKTAVQYSAQAVLGIARVQQISGTIDPETLELVRGAITSAQGGNPFARETADALREWLGQHGQSVEGPNEGRQLKLGQESNL